MAVVEINELCVFEMVLEGGIPKMSEMRSNRGPRSNDRGDRGERGDRGSRQGGPGGRMRRSRRKVCAFCADKVESIDYKDLMKLRKFLSEKGKILPRRISGNCAKHQREMTVAIKRARSIALLPYTTD